MGEIERVRALSRGLSVLVAVNEAAPASVSHIVGVTGLAKATVVRLLKSLCQDGYVAAVPNGGYRPLPKVRRLASAMMVESTFLGEVKRSMIEFGLATKWPADFLVADADAMLIVASNRDSAPITLARFEHRRYPLLNSAAGFAYLSALHPSERLIAVQSALGGHPGSGPEAMDAPPRTGPVYPENLAQILTGIARTAERGYSIKDYHAPLHGVRVYGVPVVSEGQAIGALVLVVIGDIVPENLFQTDLLPAMHGQARLFGQLNATNPTDPFVAPQRS
jgi:IclR family transcriptional regulator, mhp operon transcriptional activator